MVGRQGKLRGNRCYSITVDVHGQLTTRTDCDRRHSPYFTTLCKIHPHPETEVKQSYSRERILTCAQASGPTEAIAMSKSGGSNDARKLEATEMASDAERKKVIEKGIVFFCVPLSKS